MRPSSEDRVAKIKSEPRKTKGDPKAASGDAPKRVKKAPAAPKAAEAAPVEGAVVERDGKAASGAKPPPAKRTAPQKAAATKPSRHAAKIEKAEEPAPRSADHSDDDGDEDDEHEPEDAADENAGEDRDTSDPDADGDVVEVVGELVDDPGSEGEDAVEPRAARLSASSAPSNNEAALSRSDPLQAYLREVQRHSLLTPEEEKSLTQRYVKTQDVNTAARLVTANLRLVVKLAYEYRRAYKNIMDLIQEGNIGLMQAVKRYDPYRGVKLSSYAAWWIRAYILRFILNNWRLVKLGTTQAQRKLFFNLNKEKAKLSALGIEPTSAEIARRLSVEEKEVIDMDRRLSSGEASLDAPVGDTDGRAVSRLELMPSPLTGPDIALEAREMGQIVHERFGRFRDTLKGKDVEIFDLRMVAEEPLTLQELGDKFGISRERVRQLEARLTTKLRVYLKDELGDAVGAG
jgi:RNA polymerase sigma-32 factor